MKKTLFIKGISILSAWLIFTLTLFLSTIVTCSIDIALGPIDDIFVLLVCYAIVLQ